jgi:hypothetical protein
MVLRRAYDNFPRALFENIFKSSTFLYTHMFTFGLERCSKDMLNFCVININQGSETEPAVKPCLQGRLYLGMLFVKKRVNRI